MRAPELVTTERARLLSQIDMQALNEQLTGGHDVHHERVDRYRQSV